MIAAGHFKAEKAIGYIVAQGIGGVAAAGVFYIILSGAPAAKWNDFIAISNLYGGQDHFSLGAVALTEVVMTALFLIVIANVITRRPPGRLRAVGDRLGADHDSPRGRVGYM